MQPKILHFAGIGASKSGTSWVSACLAEHPEVYMPPTNHNKLNYFSHDSRYRKDLSNFWPDYAPRDTKLRVGEFTPNYYVFPNAISRLRYHFPSIKLILILRNPMDRILSQYKFYLLKMKNENILNFLNAVESKHNYIDYIEKSLYAKHISSIWSIVSKKNLFVAKYDNICDQPEIYIKNLYSFINVDSSYLPSVLYRKINPTPKVYHIPPRSILTLNKILSRKTYYPMVPRTIIKPIKALLQFCYNPEKFNRVSENDLSISDDQKRIIYSKYLKNDIGNLERLLGWDLTEWKMP
jgi:hypothetical protein